ncbi:WGR domain-containing protein [Ensifer adhaerens]|uniref:WGR domain-containing protein n=1 Tax=Ensifer adhaerens TaxID=106592 RepID=UPI001C4E25C5|nr:WGR domain-containing protein [Ensifer adhaerens]MBW0365485.1 WGR domain-containing protein [Ensifer adhaerens]UCM22818.1 WGR domain-containing protein [Ensifer adhaerens]
MITQPYHLYVERKDATRDLARFYAIEIVATLFGDVCLRRRCGRIGARGQSMDHHFKDEKQAVSLFFSSRATKAPARISTAVARMNTRGVVVLRLKFLLQRQLRADFFEHDGSFPQLGYRDHGAAGVGTFTRW